jgi:hypothetical protein
MAAWLAQQGKCDMSVITLPPYVPPIRLQQKIARVAALLAFAFVVAAVLSIAIEEIRPKCKPFTIGRSAIGSCDWLP